MRFRRRRGGVGGARAEGQRERESAVVKVSTNVTALVRVRRCAFSACVHLSIHARTCARVRVRAPTFSGSTAQQHSWVLWPPDRLFLQLASNPPAPPPPLPRLSCPPPLHTPHTTHHTRPHAKASRRILRACRLYDGVGVVYAPPKASSNWS